MILYGLLFGRWPRPALLAGTVVWTLLVLGTSSGAAASPTLLLGAAALGAANALAGVAVHQGVLWAVRRLTGRVAAKVVSSGPRDGV
ncbi:hypothetical protein [Sphaerisporangium aureirubrum]|uniref:Uncharacterized protein n=1 Tax=Sphaerisporangium aureirubrum TaxID=1544736 RepID=A0ABW1NQS6_9ACTN